MIFQQPTSSLNPVWDVGTPDRRGPAHPPRHEGQGGARAGPRAAAHGRHPRPGAAAQGVPARDVRRHGPARDDRDGPRLRARAAHRRRADDRARRDHPGPDPRPHAQPARRDRHGDHPHHPRPGRGRRDVRPRRGHVRGRDRRGDRCPLALPRPAPSLHARADRLDPGRRRRQGALAVIPGNVPNLIDLPPGCRFAPRCSTRVEENVVLADVVHPSLLPMGTDHQVRCWLYHDAEGRPLPRPKATAS